MANTYSPNGIGGSTGDSLALAKPLVTSGNIWFVDSATGSDAASPRGQNRERPLATLAQAITNAAGGDIIVFLDGHSETLTAAQTIPVGSAGLTLVGEGSSAGVPTVTFTNNQAAATMFTLPAASLHLRNIKFAANAQACASARLTVTGTGFRMTGCYMQCGATDTGPGVLLNTGADRCTLSGCTFISTATAASAQPESALKSGAALTDLYVSNTVFSAGTAGFSNYYAADLSTAAITRACFENVSLLLGADLKMHASTTGYVHVGTSTGNGKVLW